MDAVLSGGGGLNRQNESAAPHPAPSGAAKMASAAQLIPWPDHPMELAKDGCRIAPVVQVQRRDGHVDAGIGER